jgi:cation transport regulator ChaC
MGELAWIFGYGSLMWRPAFKFVRREPALLRGYSRRFWQGSTDHRGTPAYPGRVVTLVPERGGLCMGIAFAVAEDDWREVVGELDRREQGGYTQRDVVVRFAGGEDVQALTYVAEPGNPNYLGPAPLAAMAQQIVSAAGPSGTNREYLERLCQCLTEFGARDQDVFDLYRLTSNHDGLPCAAS